MKETIVLIVERGMKNMGMFDWVNLKTKCPKCNSFVENFQSKDAGCLMERLDVEDIDNFYATCPKCLCWIEFIRKKIKVRDKKKVLRFIDLQDLKKDFKIKVGRKKISFIGKIPKKRRLIRKQSLRKFLNN